MTRTQIQLLALTEFSNLPRNSADPAPPRATADAAGVTEFTTVNINDFGGLGFSRGWNPFRG